MHSIVSAIAFVNPRLKKVQFSSAGQMLHAVIVTIKNGFVYPGLPMIVKMVTPASAKVVEAPEKLPANVKPAASGPLK